MNCRKTASLLSAYMDGELPGVEQLQIREHLKHCTCCNEEYESLLYTKRVLARLSVANPRNCLEDRILNRLSDEAERGVKRFDPLGWWSLLAEQQKSNIRTAGLVAVLGGLCAVYWVNPFNRVQSIQSLASRPQFMGQPAYMEPQIPLPDMMRYHTVSESFQPMSGGYSAQPIPNYQPFGR